MIFTKLAELVKSGSFWSKDISTILVHMTIIVCAVWQFFKRFRWKSKLMFWTTKKVINKGGMTATLLGSIALLIDIVLSPLYLLFGIERRDKGLYKPHEIDHVVRNTSKIVGSHNEYFADVLVRLGNVEVLADELDDDFASIEERLGKLSTTIDDKESKLSRALKDRAEMVDESIELISDTVTDISESLNQFINHMIDHFVSKEDFKKISVSKLKDEILSELSNKIDDIVAKQIKDFVTPEDVKPEDLPIMGVEEEDIPELEPVDFENGVDLDLDLEPIGSFDDVDFITVKDLDKSVKEFKWSDVAPDYPFYPPSNSVLRVDVDNSAPVNVVTGEKTQFGTPDSTWDNYRFSDQIYPTSYSSEKVNP